MTLDTLITFGKNHFVEITVSYIGWNAFSSSMPPAGPDSTTGYKWLYGIVHAISLNVRNIVAIWQPKVMDIPGFQKSVNEGNNK